MGKKIDRFVLMLLAALVLYLYFFNAFENHAVAILLALLGCCIISRVFGSICALVQNTPGARRQRMRRSAGSVVMKLACMQKEDALQDVQSILNRCYGEDYCVELIQMHPSLKINPQQIFSIWRENQGVDCLVVCATGMADEECRAMTAALKSPKVALIDSPALQQMIAEQPENLIVCEETGVQRKLRFRKMVHLLINRKNAPKNLLFSASMLLMYLISGNAAYLVAALALMFAAFVSLRRNPRPAKLF